MSHNIVARRAKRGPLNTGSGTARSIRDDVAPLLDCELGSAHLPFTEDGTLLVRLEARRDVESYPRATPKPAPAIKPEASRNGGPATGSGFISSVVCDIAPQNCPRQQAQLQLQVRKLAVANRRKDEFLAMLSHELRSPLSSLQFAVRLLQRQMGGPKRSSARKR